jgi:nitrogen fixation/metabolism regulation signal transduction histidine kinase
MGRGKDETSPEERRAVLEQVLEGMTNGLTVADTARKLKIPAGRIRTWLARDPEIYAEYQRVRPMLGAAFAEEAIRVARESTSQTTAMDRVLIDTLKWAAAKSAPTEYGEKQLVEHQGQQTLQVKVIEDEVPVRNVKALREAAVTAVLKAATEAPIRTLPAPDPDEIA